MRSKGEKDVPFFFKKETEKGYLANAAERILSIPGVAPLWRYSSTSGENLSTIDASIPSMENCDAVVPVFRKLEGTADMSELTCGTCWVSDL